VGNSWVGDWARGRLMYRIVERWGPARAAVAAIPYGISAGLLLAIVFQWLGFGIGVPGVVGGAIAASLAWAPRPWRVFFVLVLSLGLGMAAAYLAMGDI
jgi:hypothetical protein